MKRESSMEEKGRLCYKSYFSHDNDYIIRKGGRAGLILLRKTWQFKFSCAVEYEDLPASHDPVS